MLLAQCVFSFGKCDVSPEYALFCAQQRRERESMDAELERELANDDGEGDL